MIPRSEGTSPRSRRRSAPGLSILGQTAGGHSAAKMVQCIFWSLMGWTTRSVASSRTTSP